MFCEVFSFPPGICVGNFDLTALITSPSILTKFNVKFIEILVNMDRCCALGVKILLFGTAYVYVFG